MLNKFYIIYKEKFNFGGLKKSLTMCEAVTLRTIIHECQGG